MGSWSCVSGGNFVCDESVSMTDRIVRSRNGLMMGCEWSSQCSYVVCSPQQGFVELGSQDLTSNNDAFYREEESSSKVSSSVVESNSRDSSLVDLKLGGFPDHHHPDAQNMKSPKMTNTLSSAHSPAPAKRMRGGGLNSQTPYCQVHGCKKDLSSCKDYHKRHKVCEAHSKTAKVIVNGIEQRFCQQCSRFHLLDEFDDGKRSCHKRLAGHNERRRKPHVGINSGRTGRLFQSYTATRFEGTAFSMSSFVCPDILPGNLVHPQTNEWYRNVKVEEPLTNQTKSLFASEKHCPPHDSGMSDLRRGRISESSSSYSYMAGSDFVYAFDSSPTIQGLSGMSNSGRALSLLSSQSQSSSSASIVPPPHSLIHQGAANDQYDMVQVSASTTTLSSPSGINSCEDAQMMLFSNSGQINPLVQGSEYMNVKNQISGEDGPTIDLLQLSSQLQRVEHQRHSMQENNTFSSLRIT